RGVKFLYANGIEMVHGGPSGCEFHGENGTLRIDRGVLTGNPVSLVNTPLGKSDLRLPKSPGHHRNWLDCIASRQRPVADVEKGARTVTIVHLGNLAYREKIALDWDPRKWEFSDKSNNRFLDRQRRDPWQLPTV
ncbi:MAG: gfo/Idh/MocA family oxidoreductase, partial [Pirellulaceae bacterium]|nr:gfo/Idh/MocA family oxidoreductase [Pirellulaceae bacterium]